MKKENAKDFLPLVQALADGKTIQFRHNASAPWVDMSSEFGFGYPLENYRIKPEPREWFLLRDPDDGLFSGVPYPTRIAAEKVAQNGGCYSEVIHVREVL
jgi:hypothetical protein